MIYSSRCGSVRRRWLSDEGVVADSSDRSEAHAAGDFADEGLFEVPLASEGASHLGKDGGADAAVLDGTTEHEDGVGKGAFLGDEVVELAGDDGGSDEQVVDGGRAGLVAALDDAVGRGESFVEYVCV